MFKVKLIFANRKQIKEAASASNYGSHIRDILLEDNWIYETSASPLFTIGYTLRHFGLVKNYQE